MFKNMILIFCLAIILGCAGIGENVVPVQGPAVPAIPHFTEEQVLQRDGPYIVECTTSPNVSVMYMDINVTANNGGLDYWRVFVINKKPALFVKRNLATVGGEITERGVWIDWNADTIPDAWFEGIPQLKEVYPKVCDFVFAYSQSITGR